MSLVLKWNCIDKVLASKRNWVLSFETFIRQAFTKQTQLVTADILELTQLSPLFRLRISQITSD